MSSRGGDRGQGQSAEIFDVPAHRFSSIFNLLFQGDVSCARVVNIPFFILELPPLNKFKVPLITFILLEIL